MDKLVEHLSLMDPYEKQISSNAIKNLSLFHKERVEPDCTPKRGDQPVTHPTYDTELGNPTKDTIALVESDVIIVLLAPSCMVIMHTTFN